MDNKTTKCFEVKEDILQIVPNEQLKNLRDLYKKDWPSHVHIYNFLDTCMKWKEDKKFENYATIYAPDGDWSDGTIVAIIELCCYDILVYSFEERLLRLQRALKQTKRINWERKLMFPSIRVEFRGPLNTTKEIVGKPFCQDIPSNIWWLPKEKALEYKWQIPSEYYLANLSRSDADAMNAFWPHKHPGSEIYIQKLIEVNGGIGLYSKTNDDLCSWVLKSYFGALGLLQTAEKYQGLGLGSLVTKIFSKKLAEEGLDIIGCVVLKNHISEKLFTRLGFEKIIAVTWLIDF